MKLNIPREKIYPHVVFLILAVAVSFIFFYPVIEGKTLNQMDVTKARGMQKEIADYHEETGDYTLWTNSMFGGMPIYQIGMANVPNYNIFHHLSRIIRLSLPRYSVDVMFLYMLGFYILLLALNVNPWLAIIGALAFSFSSYNLIYLEAGHVNKTLAIAMLPPALGGVIFTFRRKYFTGASVFLLFLGIQLAYNHLQITYYLLLMILVYGIYQLIILSKKKELKHWVVSVAMLTLAAIFSVLPNITNIAMTYEYSKVSMRGGSELAAFEEGEGQEGLDPGYAMAWSYGVWETFTIMFPNFHGGASMGEIAENSNLYEALVNNNVPANQARQYIKQVPTYWGSKSITSGPFYFGAVVVFLFVLGLFIVKNRIKWWILAISVLAILWSWGENFFGFNLLFFNYFPLFNKFRVPETFLVITSVTFPVLAILTIKEIQNGKDKKKEFLKALKNTVYVVGGIGMFFLLFAGSLFDFTSQTDAQMQGMPDWFLSALRDDRESLLKKDIIRTLLFVGIATGIIYLFLQQKLKNNYFLISIGLLIVIDLWAVDRRYLNESDFVSKKAAKEIEPTQANLQILQDPDPNFRVFNLTQSPFQESYTSYFHKSIGGYHGAKLARYQDIIENHLVKQNMDVLNMLNTKYLIVQGENNQPVARRNPDALGNAWFVNEVKIVENAKQEIDALNEIEPAETAVADDIYSGYINSLPLPDSIGSNSVITLEDYKPDYLTYTSKSETGGFVVFSEIYYNDEKGWKAYIDGEPAKHIQVNYILRGMYVPAGEHTIEYKFEPQLFYKVQKASMIFSVIVGLLILGGFIFSIRKELKPSETE